VRTTCSPDDVNVSTKLAAVVWVVASLDQVGRHQALADPACPGDVQRGRVGELAQGQRPPAGEDYQRPHLSEIRDILDWRGHDRTFPDSCAPQTFQVKPETCQATFERKRIRKQ
jgi:hypothetical protein